MWKLIEIGNALFCIQIMRWKVCLELLSDGKYWCTKCKYVGVNFLPCKKNLASNTRHAASMFEFKTMIIYWFLCRSGWCLIVCFNFPPVGVQWFNLRSLRYGVLPVHPGSRWQGHQGLWAVLQIEGGWPAMSVVLWTQSGPLWRPGHVLKTWHAL